MEYDSMNALDDVINQLDACNIVGNHDQEHKINESPYKRWIKHISLDKELHFHAFKLCKEFWKVATITTDNEYTSKGDKARNTVTKFHPTDKKEWSLPCEWVYLFTINDKIVKIGGTRNGLKQRAGSYLCGHHIKERNRSDKCSVTNGYIYNTFDFYLQNGYEIAMYGYMIPECVVPLQIMDEVVYVKAQVYHAYEARFLKEYKKIMGHYPCLSDNADPNYK